MSRRHGRRKPEHKGAGKEILVNVGPVETRIAILDNGRLVDFLMEREGVEHYAGSIYKGKVKAIVPGIEAAFVDIGMDKNGFIHASDVGDATVLGELFSEDDSSEEKEERPQKSHQRIQDILKVDQEILVQVVKEAISTKGPRLTTYLSIPGRYIVLTPFDSHIGISKRIRERDERKRIRDIFDKIKLPEGTGCIVRTMAEGRSNEELEDELKYLLNLWERVRLRADKQSAPLVVYEEYGAVLRMIRDKFTDDITHLLVDSKDEFIRVNRFLQAFRPALRKKVKLYAEHIPLFQKHDVDSQIEEIFDRKVNLKSGGSLIIEQTEGLVAIDVNSGSFTGKRNLEETAYKTNIEAAREIPHQLILRDIGGIIIIDFIDMEDRGHRESVFNVLQQELHQDKAKISLRPISQFGVVEMTRQRMRKSLESSSHNECPYCHGKGIIKSSETVAIETVRRIDSVLSRITGRHKHLTVITHPDVNVALMSNQAKMLSDIQRKHRCKINLNEDSTVHREDVIINEH